MSWSKWEGAREPDLDEQARMLLAGVNDHQAPRRRRTPITGFRIPEDVKAAAVARAEAEGKTLTDVVVENLRRYGKGKPKP